MKAVTVCWAMTNFIQKASHPSVTCGMCKSEKDNTDNNDYHAYLNIKEQLHTHFVSVRHVIIRDV